MAKLVPPPKTLTDPIKLGDWLELSALVAPDSNSSAGDLERLLRLAALSELDTDDKIENKTLEVFDELQRRALAAGPGYPFAVIRLVLQARADWRNFTSYVFCLCLSYYGLLRPRGARIFPERLFEALACVAVRNYLGGQAVRFAFPRDGLPKPFGRAVSVLCRDYIKEGEGFREHQRVRQKDDTLDVVAWRHFGDGDAGKLLMFGQCASGDNWSSKIDELQPKAFCDEWMIEPPASPLLKAFFVPHRVARQEWKRYTRRAGIIFDRCRIAAFTQPANQSWVLSQNDDFASHVEWTDWLLREVSEA